jgi:hypothetical protein
MAGQGDDRVSDNMLQSVWSEAVSANVIIGMDRMLPLEMVRTITIPL